MSSPEFGYAPPEFREIAIDTEQLVNNIASAPQPLFEAIAEVHAAKMAANNFRRVNLNNL